LRKRSSEILPALVLNFQDFWVVTLCRRASSPRIKASRRKRLASSTLTIVTQ